MTHEERARLEDEAHMEAGAGCLVMIVVAVLSMLAGALLTK